MSAYPICVCADLYGKKVNLEIPFAARPNMAELTREIRDIFDYEAQMVRTPPAPVRTFQISRMQVYNEATAKWDELTRTEQIEPHGQIYAFQPNIVDTQDDLPRARQPSHPRAQGSVHAMASYGQPSHASYQQQPMQSHVSHIRNVGERPHVDLEEKVRIVFGELDANGKQFLDYGDLERGFKQRGLHFAVNTIGELFHKADLNRDGRIMFDEWVTWCSVYPNTLDAMYYRGKDTGEEAQIRLQMRELQEMNDADHLAEELLRDILKRSTSPGQMGNAVKSLNRYIAPAAQALHADPSRDVRPDIQRALEDLAREAAQRERQLPELDAQLRAAQERRHILEQQEMNLLEQEIRLERQRDAMRQQEAKYAEAEHMFNAKANETGSPRRARRVISPSVA
ncbi:flagellar protein essential for flagellar pocket biogenesis [Diplonema papillatum]|nr:flagellar protein essential for flagellar pocket biogenesis [Diplonema papillatum]